MTNQDQTQRTSIFYVNSAGFISQWKGKAYNKTESSISIQFSKRKAFKYNLKDLDIDFVLITNKPVKNLGLNSKNQLVQFDESLKNIVLEKTKGNVNSLWIAGKWQN